MIALLVVGGACSSSDDQAVRFEGSAGRGVHWKAVAENGCIKVTTEPVSSERGTCDLDPKPVEHAEWAVGSGQLVVGAVKGSDRVKVNGVAVHAKSGYFATFVAGGGPITVAAG